MNYTLIRSRRKTAVIYLRGDTLEVRAPLHMPKWYIDKFVASREEWIIDKLAWAREQARRRDSFTLGYGDMIFYRGKQYPIVAKCVNRAVFADQRFYIPPDLAPEQIKAACIKIYRMLAKRDLTEKTACFAKRMMVMPAAVKVNNAKARWGSCSSKKSLNFSWRLVMAEDDIIDYVVVHELAHITEMNHSSRFWVIVKGVLPDYQERRVKLKELQHRLSGEDWG